MRPIQLAAFLAVLTAGAHAETRQACYPAASGVSQTGFVAPQGCCTGRMQCAQFLSTTTVVRPQREQRT